MDFQSNRHKETPSHLQTVSYKSDCQTCALPALPRSPLPVSFLWNAGRFVKVSKPEATHRPAQCRKSLTETLLEGSRLCQQGFWLIALAEVPADPTLVTSH